ncbi:hypothetical protein NONI108955_13650 [Nocardia ninae]|uniref:N-acetyltransferase domain-containing protein n=1 Tax=Nocardia ninae NBRC 108245 TaxID=1210091 RepID=A0A511MB12_9NOCA|nr:hypothetical protein [Nocardia ninae]GEM37681.1 hypothetical protein NN4_22000 [Nocardia ninae NBRC 108245]
MNDLRITVETKIPDDQIAIFHRLYEESFGPLRTKTIVKQVLDPDEFHAEMVDPRVDKHVAWNDVGEPIGLTTLTNHLETISWISPEYLTARYPEHAARDAIYYVGITLVAPSARQGPAFRAMIESVVQVLVADRAAVGWDVCSYNNTRFWFTECVQAVLDAANLEVSVEDSLTFYRAWFTGDGATKGG